jgi:hypothetical protein
MRSVGFWLFLEFSVCLSRACLGKMFGFIYKWRKKRARRTDRWMPGTAHTALPARQRILCHLFLGLPYSVCPEEVLVKRSCSYINGSKDRFTYLCAVHARARRRCFAHRLRKGEQVVVSSGDSGDSFIGLRGAERSAVQHISVAVGGTVRCSVVHVGPGLALCSASGCISAAGLGWAVRPRTGPPAADEPRTSAQCAKRRGKSTVCTASTDFIAQCMSKPIDSSKMHIFDAIWKRTAHRIASQH